MQLIKQRNSSDCMLAAIAMVVGKQYDELWTPEFVQRVVDGHGCNDDLTAEALKIAGHRLGTDCWQVYTWTINGDTKRLLWGRRAILSVPSLNYQHGSHAIAWDGRTVYDPSKLQVYQWLEHVQPTSVIVFNEVKQAQ